MCKCVSNIGSAGTGTDLAPLAISAFLRTGFRSTRGVLSRLGPHAFTARHDCPRAWPPGHVGLRLVNAERRENDADLACCQRGARHACPCACCWAPSRPVPMRMASAENRPLLSSAPRKPPEDSALPTDMARTWSPSSSSSTRVSGHGLVVASLPLLACESLVIAGNSARGVESI